MDRKCFERLSAMVVGPSAPAYAESNTKSSSTILPAARHTPQLTGHQAAQPLEIISFLSAEGPIVGVAPDINMGGIIILDDPQNFPTSKVNETFLQRICERYTIPYKDMLVPSCHQRVHLPPVRYTVCN